MTVNHDAVAALPTTGSASKTLLRNLAVARMPYVLADADDSRNLIAIDPSTGAIIVDLMLLGRVFHYDPTDTTTAHDGTSCLVSADGLRYKLALGSDVFAYAVLDNTISTPPVSPALGDAYLVAAGATGAWAGKSNFIAVKTNRGWEFLNFSIGRFVYVESVDTYYHKNAGGAWVAGLGNSVLNPLSVPITAIIGANASFIIKVENKTTTAPPGSPAVPTAYIIGPSATGAWAGQDGKLAICLVAGSFTIITPTTGDTVYDKALAADFRFNGSAWVSSKGLWTSGGVVKTASGSTTTSGTGSGYVYTPVTAPTQALAQLQDLATLSVTAPAGSRIRFNYQCGFNQSVASADTHTFALFRDAVSNAVDWTPFPSFASSVFFGGNFIFEATAPDSSAHTYKISAMFVNATNFISALNRRIFSYEVAS